MSLNNERTTISVVGGLAKFLQIFLQAKIFKQMKLILFRFTTVLLFVLFTVLSCQNDKDTSFFDLSNGEIEMTYDETQCSDPWYELIISHSERSKENILKDFLRLKNINFLEVAYDKANPDQVITCTACDCFTGAVFYIKINDEKNTIENLQEIGFKL